MITQTLSIARNAFVESVRQPIVAILILISGITQLLNTAMTGFSMGLQESGEVKSDDKLLFDIGLSAVFGLGTILASFIATSVLSREIENKTVLTVVSKPVSRATLIIGKYLGVAASLLIATSTMLIFLLLAIRHGVMSTASDELDQPVLVFTAIALFLSIGLAAWCNYFYRWSFPQTMTLLLLPFMFIAYVAILFVNKKWEPQPFFVDLKFQIAIACVSLTVAILVFAAIATAVSTRLSQVMTIVVCVGIFMVSLLSNHFLGGSMFKNTLVGKVTGAQSLVESQKAPFEAPNDNVVVVLNGPPMIDVKPGMPFYYSASPNGYPLSHDSFTPYTGTLSEHDIVNAASPALVVTSVKGDVIQVRQVGLSRLEIRDPIVRDDYVFLKPTQVQPVAFVLWAAVPNMQHFWLLDAITQNQPIPVTHLGLIFVYGLFQIAAFLALGIALFQTRDVG